MKASGDRAKIVHLVNIIFEKQNKKINHHNTNQPKSYPSVPALASTHQHMHTYSFPAVSVLCQAQAERGGKSGGVTINMLQLLAVLSEREATYHLDIAPRVSRTHTNQTACQLPYMNSVQIQYIICCPPNPAHISHS